MFKLIKAFETIGLATIAADRRAHEVLNRVEDIALKVRFNVGNYFYFNRENGGLFADAIRGHVRAIRSETATVKAGK